MKLQCPKCATGISVDENKYQDASIFIACPKCQQKIKVNLPAKVVAQPNNTVPVIPNIPNISNITQNNTQYEEKSDTSNNVFGLQVILGILILLCLGLPWIGSDTIFEIGKTHRGGSSGMAVAFAIIGCAITGMSLSRNTNNANKVAYFCMLPILSMSAFTILTGGQAPAPFIIFFFALLYFILALCQRKATFVSTRSKNNNNNIKSNTVVYEGGNVKSVTVEYDNNNNISANIAPNNQIAKSKLGKVLEIDEMLFRIQFLIALIIVGAAFATFEGLSQFGLTSVMYISLVVFSSIFLVLLSKNTNRNVNKNVKISTLFIILILLYIISITAYQIAFMMGGKASILVIVAISLYGIVVAIKIIILDGRDSIPAKQSILPIELTTILIVIISLPTGIIGLIFWLLVYLKVIKLNEGYFIPEKQPITPIPRKNILIVGILLAIGTIALIGEGVYLKMPKNTEISSASADNTNSTSDIYITVTAEKAIKLRKTPSLDLEEINIIPTGTRLKLIEKTNQKDTFEGIESYWYKVQYANTIGYVFGGFTDADKRAVANNSSTSSTQKMLQNYFQEVENGTMRAENYFSPSVIQFITVKNTTPQGVNQAFASNTEFVNQQNTITSDLTLTRQENGINYYSFWTSFRCLRRSLGKYQLCNTKIEVGIDQNTKICSYKEISVDNLRYEDANGNSSQNAPDYNNNNENYEREVPSGYAQAVTESGCTIRSEPTVRSEQTDFVPRWEMMQVLAKTNVYQKIEDKSGYWYKISYNGKVGYCFGGFMKVNF